MYVESVRALVGYTFFTSALQMLMFSNCILFYVAAQAVIENYLLTLLS